MSTTKQIPEVTKVPDGCVCKMHSQREDALVWFSPSVVSIYQDYESRHKLTLAVRDEINTIPSDYIPYGMVFFNETPFVFSAFWCEKDDHWAIEIDLGGEPVLAGYV